MENWFSSIIDWLNKIYHWLIGTSAANKISFDAGFPLPTDITAMPFRIGISFLVAIGLLVASVVLIGTFENRIFRKGLSNFVIGSLYGFYSVLFIFSGVFMSGVRVFDFRFLLLALVGTAYGSKKLAFLALPYMFVSYMSFGYPLVDAFILIYAIIVSLFHARKDFKAIIMAGGILPMALLEKPIAHQIQALDITPVIIFGIIMLALLALLGAIWLIVIRNRSLTILNLQKYIGAILHNNANICHFKIDKARDKIKISKSFFKMFELSAPTLEYSSYKDFIKTFSNVLLATPDLIDAEELFTKGHYNIYVNTAVTHSSQLIEIFTKRTIFGRRKGVLVNNTNVLDSGEMVMEMQKTDFLTGLKTAYVIRDEISRNAKLKRGLVLQMHISFADLNRHTSLFGVDFYNNALKTIAMLLRDNFKNMNIFSFKNGEFHLTYFGLVNAEEANKYKERLYALFNAPVNVSGRDIKVLVTCGLKVSESADVDNIEKADRSVAQTIWSQIKASEMGQNHSYMFNPERYFSEQSRNKRIEKLPVIINERQFKTLYQPIVDAKTGQIFSYEALSTVNNEVYKSIGQVIGDAMFCNMSADLDNALLNCLLEDIRKINIGSANLFVNILPNTPFLPVFADINRHLESVGSKLFIEFTEYEKADTSLLSHFTNQLKAHGIHVALDDYGAGYASPNFLLSISPNVVKLDMELVRGAHYDKNKSYLISTIIHYCKESNILCLAEGIENWDDLKKLIELGIDLVQGYYIGKPASEPTQINLEITKEIMLCSQK